jgi:hypothetical protein
MLDLDSFDYFEQWTAQVMEEMTLNAGSYTMKNIREESKVLADDYFVSLLGTLNNKYEAGDSIYIAKELHCNNLFKVGSSLNMNATEVMYEYHFMSTKILYTRRCINSKLLLKVLLHKLDDYRVNEHGWVKIDFNTLRQMIDKVQKTIDQQESSYKLNEEFLKMTIDI